MADTKFSGATALTGTGLVSRGAARAGSTTAYRTVDNLIATTDPTANDDTGDGFHIGSMWFNSSTFKLWICADATLTAAVWRQQADAGKNLSDMTAATVRTNIAAATKRFSTYVSGRYYFCPDIIPAAGSAQAINTVYCFPFMVYESVTVSELAVRVSTLQAAKNATAAIYANVTATTRPGTLLAAGNSIATQFDLGTASNQAQALTSNAALVPGVVYWMAYNSNGSTALVAGIAPSTGAAFIGGAVADLWNAGQANTVVGVSTPLAYTTTWPDLTAATWTVVSQPVAASIMPNVAFKVA
jgi:hypothetical protein